MRSYNFLFTKDKSVVYVFDTLVFETFTSLFLSIILVGIIGLIPLGFASLVFTFGAILWGVPLGFILSLPCLFVLYGAYKVFLKKRLLNCVYWVLTSVIVASVYVGIIYFISIDFPFLNLMIYFFAPVSCRVGYRCWKKIVLNNLAVDYPKEIK